MEWCGDHVMKTGSGILRFVILLAIVIAVMTVTSLTYGYSSQMAAGPIRGIVSGISTVVLFMSIWLPGFVWVPVAFLLGLSPGERFVIGIANPVIWITRMCISVACQFTAVEILYFLLLPWTFGAMNNALLQFSLTEMACRFIVNRKKDVYVRALHPGLALLAAASTAGLYFGLVRGQEWVYMIVNHYADNFIR
jgi:hypothetical protein